MQIGLEVINNTPLFTSPDGSAYWERVYGATFVKKRNQWFFPAFPPFVDRVLHDFTKVNKNAYLSDKSQELVNNIKTQNTWLDTAKEINKQLPTKGYDHQVAGLAYLLENYRYILQWEMGTGKSKVIVDALLQWGSKALILCPVVGIDSWLHEIKVHSGGALTAVAMRGGSRKTKLKRLREALSADILITPYDTARVHAVPKIYKKASEYLDTRRVYPTPTLKRALSIVNDPEIQLELAKRWFGGENTRKINIAAQAIAGDDLQWVIDYPYDVIVSDESHRIKRLQSQRTKACLKLSAKAPRRYLLSGTLSLGDPRDLYPQLKFLAPYLQRDNYQKFCDEHLVRSPWNKHIVTSFKNLHVLNDRLDLVSDRKKLLDCVDLPPRVEQTVFFDLSKEQINDYNYAVKESCLEIPNQGTLEIPNGAIKISKLLQICSGFLYTPVDTSICERCPPPQLQACVEDNVYPGSNRCTVSDTLPEPLRYGVNPKLKVLDDLLEDLLEQDTKSIIWANFTAELDDIEKLLKKKKVGYVRIDGKTSKDIGKLSAKFQSDPKCVIYLGQIRTGIAVTLTAAAYTVYYSRSWSLEDWLQSRNRNYRIGQKQKTVVYRLCARATVEEQQLSALDMKRDISHLLVQKVDCVTCSMFKRCLADDIEPWTARCILDREVKRKTTRAKEIV